MRKLQLSLALLGGFALTDPAHGNGVEKAGDVLQIALPAGGYLLSVGLEDYEGTRQLTRSLLATLTTTFALKYAIDAKRPDGSGQAFPSGHTAAAFSGAMFIQRRYGPRLGIPALAAAGFVAWSRVDAGRHEVKDVVAGAGLAILCGHFLVDRLPGELFIVPVERDGFLGLRLTGIW
ncbi:phosphatase PAP2 family protein [Myxococcota bacterium]|nr:phosphatase PAP2 family protein [Myxococcota bacterium]